jgi:hypothetical protein
MRELQKSDHSELNFKLSSIIISSDFLLKKRESNKSQFHI